MKQFSVKRLLLVVLILCAALCLCACKGGDGANYPTQEPTQPAAMTLPTDLPATGDLTLPEDTAEDNDALYEGSNAAPAANAGATPVPLDPVDMPTATPRPELTFTYVDTAALSLGLKFQIPGNFYVDESQTGVVVYTDPTTMDNVNATFTIKLANVSADYTVDDIKDDVKNEMALLGQYNYTDWSTTGCQSRTLMGKDGYYADYRGVMVDGTIVRGRVQMALLSNNQLLTIQYHAPGWFNSSYKAVFDNLRSTLAVYTQE